MLKGAIVFCIRWWSSQRSLTPITPQLGSSKDLLGNLLSWWICISRRIRADGLMSDCCHLAQLPLDLSARTLQAPALLPLAADRTRPRCCKVLGMLIKFISRYFPTHTASYSAWLPCIALNRPSLSHTTFFALNSQMAGLFPLPKSQLKYHLFTDSVLGHIF